MTRLSLAGILLFASCLIAQTASTDSTAVSAKPNGYIRAEHGLFSLTGGVLCAYSSSKVGEETDCHRLVNGEWQSSPLPKQSSVEYLDFGPCDPLNQLDVGVQHSELIALLPRRAAIKQVLETNRFALVAYSDTPHARVRDSIRVAVLRSDGKGWSVAADLNVGADGNFCGMRWLEQPHEAVALVYVNEPSGSSDYSAIHSFRLSFRP